VEPDELPAWAEGIAAELLSPLADRWRHVQAVAARAREVSATLPPEERPWLVAAAWLHDIGYAPTLVDTGFHPLDGARHVRALGQERLAGLVAHHSAARFEAKARGLAKELAEFKDERSDLTAALTYCDMTTGPVGEPMTWGDRLADAERRYGPSGMVPRSLRAASHLLARSIAQTEERLGASNAPRLPRWARTVILIALGLGLVAGFAVAAFSTWPTLAKLGIGFLACVFAVAFVWLLREAEQRRWSRLAVVVATVLGLYLAVIPLGDAINPRSKLPGCRDVGVSRSGENHPYHQLFQAAYDDAGGHDALGCTRRDPYNGYVHQWGPGVSQDFEGRNGILARLMLLPEYDRVVVVQTGLSAGYTMRYGPDTGPKIGYPIEDPRPCGRAKIVHLAQGEEALSPGAMVTSPKPDEWIWLPRPFWERYRDLGGPSGRLGLPVERVKRASVNDEVMKFEGGELYLTSGTRVVKTDKELQGARESSVRPLPDCLTAAG
jgi:hypothetical protein